MRKKMLYYTSAVAAPLLAFGLVAVPAFAQNAPQNAPQNARAERPALSAEQKATLDQVRELHKQGKHDEAIALLESAGLPARRPMMRRQKPMRMPEEMREHREGVREAVLNGDYATFQELTKDAPFAPKIDETTFAVLVEAAKLREAGDIEGAKALLDEAGIKPPHPGKAMGKWFHKGFRQPQK